MLAIVQGDASNQYLSHASSLGYVLKRTPSTWTYESTGLLVGLDLEDCD
jgi:hypothetical protein